MVLAIVAALTLSRKLWECDGVREKPVTSVCEFCECLCVSVCLAEFSMLIDSSVAYSITPNRAVNPSPPL